MCPISDLLIFCKYTGHLLRYFAKISPRRAKARLRVIFAHASYLRRLFTKGLFIKLILGVPVGQTLTFGVMFDQPSGFTGFR